jgi:hypothetical protein
MQNSFAMGANLIRDLLAGLVPGRDHDFDADQLEALEGESRSQARRTTCEVTTALRGSYPVTQVAEMKEGMKMTETAAAKESISPCISDRKPEVTALGPARSCDRDPVLGLSLLVIVMSPGHPGFRSGSDSRIAEYIGTASSMRRGCRFTTPSVSVKDMGSMFAGATASWICMKKEI